MTAAPLVEIRNLGVRAGATDILRDVSFTLQRGRTLALIGESGSGKSMTALAMLGLLPHGVDCQPSSRLVFDAAEVPLDDERAMRRLRGHRIGIVFQDPGACLNPFMRIGDQIEEALARAGVRRGAERRDRTARLLREVELPEAMTARYPHEISGGQQQRVMIAMALAGEPDLLIADEPTSALDATIAAGIIALLAGLQSRRGMAMLFITHDLSVARALAHEVAVMRRGEVVEAGRAGEVLTHPRHPYTTGLVEARRTLECAPRPAGGEAEIVAAADAVSIDYRGKGLFARPVRAVHQASLALRAGRTLGILGQSGSGKSTLASALAGLRPPAEGSIRVLGARLTPSAPRLPRASRRSVQFVFQNPYGALNPRLTVRRLLGEPLALAGADEARHGAIEAALEEVGLEPGMAERYPHQLSGGQRQRVCIARALLCDPKVLVCDEVVSALDMTVQVQILLLLKRLQEERGFAMAFIGHDIDVVRWISDEIVVMHAGRIVDHVDAHEIASPQRHVETRRLMASHRHEILTSAA
ncbi:dipeptide ABC transporter ATP-binding protein [Lutibaculum baratangense]|uniref:Putative ATP-binding component of ABC transporter n=1 Tax=Lutibaculum baratangense AMV1 TaxID=631454 RepID=V4TFL0_9HYPH|nr:ABC transporter ATP-binding protein [Lutibaculum baratangense]ESR24918.1 putative ATP-binding component of ABC transporter [Lutibaculum baratangense AMV1]